MWLTLGFLSALLLGFYDLAKKTSLRDNDVLVVLLLNTLFCSVVFCPSVIASAAGWVSRESCIFVPWNFRGGQPFILLKSVMVLASWVLGYYGIKNLPLTIVGPINATRPMMALVGALIVFGERLNLLQWLGVITAVVSFFLLSRTGKKEGVDFMHNRAVVFVAAAAVLGAANTLYDKFLMAAPENGGLGLNRMEVLSWYNIYQFLWMCMLVAIMRRGKGKGRKFRWLWSIPLISIFLIFSDFTYLSALSCDGAMVSILSMVRRSNVLVSFVFGVLLLGEKNWRGKALDLLLVALGMAFVWLGTH